MRSAIVIGAGVMGLATARALGVRGYQVTVIERSAKAVGASIRNFGMIWPIGQPDGTLYDHAMRSKSIWLEICNTSDIWHDPVGSLHLAYADDEMNVLAELSEIYKHRGYDLLSPVETLKKSPAANAQNIKGSLYSINEMIVDPREAIRKLPPFLEERYGVKFLWGTAATDVSFPSVYAGKEEYEADAIFICSGTDFETLYPELFATQPITRCKLQMMRLEAQPKGFRIGPAMCGGLSLMHYHSFKSAPSLIDLRKRYEFELADYLRWGIHVMAAQNEAGEVTIGDSHEYGAAPDPFDKSFINDLILQYLSQFATFKNSRIIESWNGMYTKLTNGESNLIFDAEPGVKIINGVGGAGMTLSFGVCEDVVASL